MHSVPSDAPSSINRAVVRFGVFEADLRSGELRRNGVKVKIQELPFKALTLLLSRPNEVLSREEFRQVLWPDGVFVDFEHGITTAINRLRDALEDSAANPRFIETLERRGYRWIAPIHVPEAPAAKTAEWLNEEPASRGLMLDTKNGNLASSTLPHRKYLLLAVAVLLVAGIIFWPRSHSSKYLVGTAAPSSLSASTYPHPSANREAEELYLKGRYFWEKRTPDSLSKAVDAFTQAIVHDPSYAPAYVGLADCYNLLREYTVMPASAAYPRALAAAKKAVELDPQSSEAHASLAFVSFYGMWDVPTADREFRRAIELNPGNAVAHHWYATYLSCLRRYSESLAEMERAQALDPASKSVLADKGSILFDAGRSQEGIALLKQIEENDPDFISPHRYLKFIYLQIGDYANFLVEAKKEAVLMHDDPALMIAKAAEEGFAAGGRNGLLATLSTEQKKLYDRGQLSPFFLAMTYSIMGNKQEAVSYLKIAYKQRVDGIIQIESDHAFDNLSRDPDFRNMLADAGLPPLD